MAGTILSWNKVRNGDRVRVKLTVPCDGIGSDVSGSVIRKRMGHVAILLTDCSVVDAYIGEDTLLDHTPRKESLHG